MRIYRYPPRALTGDYLRAGVGFCVGLGVLLSVPPSPTIVAVFGGVSGLFGFFGLRTLQRQFTKVAVTDDEICSSGFGTNVMAWRDLRAFKLRYYGTKRQHRASSGFMELKLKGAGRSFTFESTIEGFTYIAWRATKAMRENGKSIDPASAGNLLAIGLDADGEKPPPEP
jgi:hypothetical protein